MLNKYKTKQDEIQRQMKNEKAIYIEKRFNKIIEDKSRNSFWKEKRRMTKNPALQSQIIKNSIGDCGHYLWVLNEEGMEVS